MSDELTILVPTNQNIAIVKATTFTNQILACPDAEAVRDLIDVGSGGGGGGDLPSDASGILINDGDGNLSWTEDYVTSDDLSDFVTSSGLSTELASYAPINNASFTGSTEVDLLAVDLDIVSDTSHTITGSKTITIGTGTGSTWTLPAVSGRTKQVLIVMNLSTLSMTVSRAGSDQIYASSGAVNSITIPVRQSAMFVNNGTYWVVIGDYNGIKLTPSTPTQTIKPTGTAGHTLIVDGTGSGQYGVLETRRNGGVWCSIGTATGVAFDALHASGGCGSNGAGRFWAAGYDIYDANEETTTSIEDYLAESFLSVDSIGVPGGVVGIDENGDIVGPILIYGAERASFSSTVLEANRLAYDTDNNTLYIGDGTTEGGVKIVDDNNGHSGTSLSGDGNVGSSETSIALLEFPVAPERGSLLGNGYAYDFEISGAFGDLTAGALMKVYYGADDPLSSGHELWSSGGDIADVSFENWKIRGNITRISDEDSWIDLEVILTGTDGEILGSKSVQGSFSLFSSGGDDGHEAPNYLQVTAQSGNGDSNDVLRHVARWNRFVPTI